MDSSYEGGPVGGSRATGGAAGARSYRWYCGGTVQTLESKPCTRKLVTVLTVDSAGPGLTDALGAEVEVPPLLRRPRGAAWLHSPGGSCHVQWNCDAGC
jgi:hypothetical protein